MSGEPQVFNKQHLADSLGLDDTELLAEILVTFLDDMPDQLVTLETALAQSEWELVERIAHTIKGASATIGAEQMRDAAWNIESPFKHHISDPDLPSKLEVLKNLFITTQATINPLVGR